MTPSVISPHSALRPLPLTLVLAVILAHLPAAVARAGPSSHAPVAQAAPVQAGPTVVEADEIAYDAATRVVTARGRARVTHPRFRLFADLLTFDLERQVIIAEGRVRLIEVGGRELRGSRIVYDVARESGTITGAETIIDQTYLRGERVEVSPDRLVVHEATATICDPRAPLYRITARRIEIIPGEALIAHDASLWLGSIRLITLREYRLSLRPAEARRGPNLPGFGYNQTDGFWVDYRYGYRLGDVGGEVYAKYGQLTGLFALNTLQYDRPAWSVTLRVGRTQHQESSGLLRAFSQAEAVYTAKAQRVGGTPLLLSGALGVGWFHETDTAVGTTRIDGTVTLATETLTLGPRLTAFASASYRLSVYGTGQQREVLTTAAQLTYRFDAAMTATLRHDFTTQRGATPFLFDGVSSANTLALNLARLTADYRLQAGVSHNFLVPETKLAGGVGVRVSPNLFLDVDAVYNLRTQLFEDIDYGVTYRCDCATVSVRYRQVRREFSIQFTLTISDRLTFTQPAP